MIIPVLFDSTICISKHLSVRSRGGARGPPPPLFSHHPTTPETPTQFSTDPPPPPPPPPSYLRIWMTSSFLSVYWFTYLFTFFCLFNTSKGKMLTRVQTLQKSRKVNMKYCKETVTICTKIYKLQLIN